MKKMRRIAIVFMLVAVLLSGCVKLETTRTVPEKMLEWAIEDYFKAHLEQDGDTPTYEYEIQHDPDKETKTDAVSIKLTVTYATSFISSYTSVTNYNAVYHYDQQADDWSLIRGGQWSREEVKSYSLPQSAAMWVSLISDLVSFEDCDINNSTDFYSLYPDPTDNLGIDWDLFQRNFVQGFQIYFGDNSGILIGFELSDSEYALNVFYTAQEAIKRSETEFLNEGWSITDERIGENYSIIKVQRGDMSFDESEYVFRVDNYLYFAHSEWYLEYPEYSRGARTLNALFYRTGLIESE